MLEASQERRSVHPEDSEQLSERTPVVYVPTYMYTFRFHVWCLFGSYIGPFDC